MTLATVATIREIDNEITRHRQEIAKHRLWISQLEDTKLNLMQLAEIKAADNGHASPFGRLPDGVQIVVRDQLPAPDNVVKLTAAGVPRKKHKPRDLDREREMRNARKAAALEAGGEVRKSVPQKSKERAPKASASGFFRPKVLETLTGLDDGGMTRLQLGDYLGIPRGDKPRKGLSNAITYLQASGQIVRSEDGHFSLA